jgi:peptide/nickel transport system substrate-binding protein
MKVGQKVLDLFNVANYAKRVEGYKELNKLAVESGATMPLLQSVQTLVRKNNLHYTKYGNGWVLPQTMAWS